MKMGCGAHELSTTTQDLNRIYDKICILIYRGIIYNNNNDDDENNNDNDNNNNDNTSK